MLTDATLILGVLSGSEQAAPFARLPSAVPTIDGAQGGPEPFRMAPSVTTRTRKRDQRSSASSGVGPSITDMARGKRGRFERAQAKR